MKLTSKFISLYPLISASLGRHHRFAVQRLVVGNKNHKLSTCGELSISGGLNHKWVIGISTSLRFRNQSGKEGRKTSIIMGKRDRPDQNSVFCIWQDHYTHEYTVSVVTWARTAQKSNSQYFSMVQKGGHSHPPRLWTLWTTDIFCEWKNQFPLRVWTLVSPPGCRRWPHI